MDLEFDFEKRYRLHREIIETLILTILMFLVIRLAVQNFNIDGHSMEPGLHDQELVLVDKWSYHFHAPGRGDVIVFVAPPDPAQDYIKRVIGLPGDIISVQGTTVSVNGHVLSEIYVDPQRQGNPFPSFTNRVIPANTYFVLGDNRGGSSDSRNWGCVPAGNIIGRAAMVYWPLGQDNNGFLKNESNTYTSVPSSPPAGLTASNTCPITNSHSATGDTSLHAVPAQSDASTLLLLALPTLTVLGSGLKQRWRYDRAHSRLITK